MSTQIRVAMVFAPARPGQDEISDYVSRLVAALSEVEVQVWPVPVRRSAADLTGWWAAVRRAARTVRALQPDLVHVQFAPVAYRFSRLPGLLPLLLPTDTPLVTTVHTYGWRPPATGLSAAVWRPLERAGWWDQETGRLAPASATVLTTHHGHAGPAPPRAGQRSADTPSPTADPAGDAATLRGPHVALTPGIAPDQAGPGDTALNGVDPTGDAVARLRADDQLRHQLAEVGVRWVDDRIWPQVAAAHRAVYEQVLAEVGLTPQ